MLLSIGSCLLCGYLDELTLGVCRRCDELIKSELFSAYSPSSCPICGDPQLHIDSVCSHHGQQDPVYIQKVGFYSSYLKELIIRYKFSPCRTLSAYMASLILPMVRNQAQPSKLIWIVFVPCSIKGFRNRGWDQMELIAEQLAKTPGIGRASILVRIDGKEQKLKSKEKRMMEAAGAFALDPHKNPLSSDRGVLPDSIVLIDDVHTTGATMNECIKLLQSHFTCRVSGICLAMD